MLDLVQRLAAYIPATLARQIMAEGLPPPGTPRDLTAATLFSDISGFTAMSEELASDGPRGAEELNQVLLITFTAMIDVINDLGGAVSHFYGDAMSVYFPDEDGTAASRSLGCAREMQQLMLTSFGRAVTNRPPGKNPFFPLTIKIGVGYGRCQELIVGDPAKNLEFVLTGLAVDEAAIAEKYATSGQVVASRAVLQKAGMPTTADFQLVDSPSKSIAPQPILRWSDYNELALQRLMTVITAFIPPALYERITQTGTEDVAEHRPVTSIFVQFEYTGDEDESSAIETAEMGHKLQHYYQWASQVITRFGSHNARLNRVLTGDKGNQLHIMFGAPVAPDAPDQALRCALALQKEKPGYITTQKIGLAAGRVFAGPVGSTDRREYTVVGDIVNLSARLMQICGKNCVFTNATTAERARDLIEFETLPAVPLKGKQQAVVPYRAVGERNLTTQLQVYFSESERPLIGREKEQALLLSGMDTARRGTGGMSALFGSVGVGKTRLLSAGVKQWLEWGGAGLVGVCHQHTQDNPFAPWQNIWRDFFKLHPDMDVALQSQTVVQQTQRLVPDCGDDVGLWADGLGLPIPQAATLVDLTAAARQARFFSLVRKCFQASAQKQPLLLVLEDLHWADQATLALVDELADHLEHSFIFMALTFRPEEGNILREGLNRPFCIQIVLNDLPPLYARELLLQHLTEMTTAAAVHPPGPEDLKTLEQYFGLQAEKGSDYSNPVSPLFMAETLNVMRTVGVLKVNGRIQIDKDLLSQMQLPDNIYGLLLARLDSLPPANRDLLQIASIIGRQFELQPLVTIVSALPRHVITGLLAELSKAEMTRLVTGDPKWIYLFQHAMTHEVAYESLPYARRQTLHAAVADWLEERYQDNLKPLYPILAYHYDRADIHDKGMFYALSAARDARDIFANNEALDLYHMAENHLLALGMEENWETAVNLYLSRGDVYRVVGQLSNGLADAEKALQLAITYHNPFCKARASNLMAQLKYRQVSFEEAWTITNRVIVELGTEIPADELACAYQWAGMAAGALGNYETAVQYLQQAEELCAVTRNNGRLALVLEATAYVYYAQEQLEQALPFMKRSVELSRHFSTSHNVASALNNIALVQFKLGQAQAALDTLNEAIALLREISLKDLGQALGNRAEVLTYLGRFREALVDFEEAVSLFEAVRTDDEGTMIEVHLLWGYEYCSQLGEWEAARQHFAQAQRLMATRPDEYLDIEQKVRLLIGVGQVELKAGDMETAVSLLDEAIQLANERGVAWWLPVALYLRGLAHREWMVAEQAVEDFQQGIQAIGQGGNRNYLPLLWWEVAQLETDEGSRFLAANYCLKTAETQARHLDQMKCFQLAGTLLADAADPDWHKIGLHYLEKVQNVPATK